MYIKGAFFTTACLSLFTVILSDTDRRNWNLIITYGISAAFWNSVFYLTAPTAHLVQTGLTENQLILKINFITSCFYMLKDTEDSF